MGKILTASVLISFVLLAADARLQLGQKAPPFDNSPAGSGRIALVFLPVLASGTACQAELEGLQRLQEEVRKLDVSVVLIPPYTEANWRSVCPTSSKDIRLVFDPDRRISNLHGANRDRLGVLIDEQGAVRRIVRSSPQFANRFATDIRAWEDGKAAYEAQCARCHGADGTSTGYAEIKTLAGIGNRMDEAEIIRRTSLTSNVDLSSLTDARFRALAIYVAGL